MGDVGEGGRDIRLFILNMLRLPGTQEDSLIGDGAIDFEPFCNIGKKWRCSSFGTYF